MADKKVNRPSAELAKLNKDRLRILLAHGYKGIKVDGSWGPYQLKLWDKYTSTNEDFKRALLHNDMQIKYYKALNEGSDAKISLWDDYPQYRLPFILDKAVTLKGVNPRYRGATFSTNMLDSLYKDVNYNKKDFDTALALFGNETMFGKGRMRFKNYDVLPYLTKDNSTSNWQGTTETEALSNWQLLMGNVGLNSLYDNIDKILGQFNSKQAKDSPELLIPTQPLTKLDSITLLKGIDILSRQNSYMKEHPLTESPIKNLVDLYNKNPELLNPGAPKYVPLIEKTKQELNLEPAIIEWKRKNFKSDGGSLKSPLDWNELTMKEKAAYIRMGVANGYKDIDSIKEVYNEFKCGGNLYKEGGPKKQEYIYDVLPRLLKEAGLNIRVTSGYRKPGVVGTAGNRSWHPRHGAVDIVPMGKTTFEDIEEVLHTNPTIVKYMLDNGFGLLDESGRSLASRDTMKRTGATGAHFHIGRDSKPAALYKQRVALYSPMTTTDNRKVYFSNPHLPIPEDNPQPKQVVSIQTPAKPLLNTTLDSNIPTGLIVMQLEEPVVDKLIPEVVVTALAPRRYAMPNPQELLDLMNSMMVPYEPVLLPLPKTATERLAEINQERNSLLTLDLEDTILRNAKFGIYDNDMLKRKVEDLLFYKNMSANGGKLFELGGDEEELEVPNDATRVASIEEPVLLKQKPLEDISYIKLDDKETSYNITGDKYVSEFFKYDVAPRFMRENYGMPDEYKLEILNIYKNTPISIEKMRDRWGGYTHPVVKPTYNNVGYEILNRLTHPTDFKDYTRVRLSNNYKPSRPVLVHELSHAYRLGYLGTLEDVQFNNYSTPIRNNYGNLIGKYIKGDGITDTEKKKLNSTYSLEGYYEPKESWQELREKLTTNAEVRYRLWKELYDKLGKVPTLKLTDEYIKNYEASKLLLILRNANAYGAYMLEKGADVKAVKDALIHVAQNDVPKLAENPVSYAALGGPLVNADSAHIYDGITEDSQLMNDDYIFTGAPSQYDFQITAKAPVVYWDGFNWIGFNDLGQRVTKGPDFNPSGARIIENPQEFENARLTQARRADINGTHRFAEKVRGVTTLATMAPMAGPLVEAATTVAPTAMPWAKGAMELGVRPTSTIVRGLSSYIPQVSKVLPYMESIDRGIWGTSGLLGMKDAYEGWLSGEKHWGNALTEGALSGLMLGEMSPVVKNGYSIILNKLNAPKPQWLEFNKDAMYRIIGEEGYQDAINTGILRPNMNPNSKHYRGLNKSWNWFTKGYPNDGNHLVTFANGKHPIDSRYPGDVIVEVSPEHPLFDTFVPHLLDADIYKTHTFFDVNSPYIKFYKRGKKGKYFGIDNPLYIKEGTKSPSYLKLFSSPERTGVFSKVITDPNDANFVLKVPKEGLTLELVLQAITLNQTLGKYPFMLPLEHVETITGDDGLLYPIWRQLKITPYGREAIFGPDGKLLQGEALEALRAKSNEIVEAIRQLAQQQGLQLLDGRISTPDGLILDFGEFHNVGITSDGRPVIYDGLLNTATKMLATPTITAENAASITPEQWTAAQDAAIARGDKAEAQRLRDLHFKVNSGVTPKLVYRGDKYHNPRAGTTYYYQNNDTSKEPWVYHESDLTPKPLKYLDADRGIYFTDSYPYAELFSNSPEKIGSYYLRIKAPYTAEEPINFKYVMSKYKEPGFHTKYDGIIGKDAPYYINPSWDEVKAWDGNQGDISVIRTSNNAKLSDAVTYGDNGDRIPLGERDNFNINDVRYSWLPWLLGGTTAYGLYKK